MKLYFFPGACSFSPHLVACELGLDIALEKVDTKSKQTEAGQDFLKINPKGSVPALELDNGEVLTEGPAILQYLGDLRPETGLVPANGTFARYRLQEMLNYITSELHKGYSPLFSPTTPETVREERKQTLLKRYALIEAALSKHPYLLGDTFSVADAYLFTVTTWAAYVDLDLSAFPSLLAFQTRVGARPATLEALEAERQAKKQAA